GEFVRSHRRAVDPVASCLCSDVEDRVADSGGAPVENAIRARDTAGEGVDEDVSVVACVELHLAADRRDPEAVAMAAAPGDDAPEELGGSRMVRASEAERVEAGDGACTHREDVAQDAADARSRSLVRLDVTRVIVRLHFEDRGESIPDVDDARV